MSVISYHISHSSIDLLPSFVTAQNEVDCSERKFDTKRDISLHLVSCENLIEIGWSILPINPIMNSKFEIDFKHIIPFP